MKMVFLGCGRVSRALCVLFSEKGHKILGAYSKTLDSARAVSPFVFDSIEDAAKDAEVIFIGTGDGVISSLAEELSKCELDFKNKIFVHFSAALSSDVLLPLRKKGASILSFHPIYSFTEGCTLPCDLHFTAEGEGERVDFFLNNIGVSYFIINKEQKALYHTACVMMNNLAVSLYASSFELLDLIGINNKEAFKPLLSLASENVLKMPFSDALTGPIARGDRETVLIHLSALSDKPLLDEIYRSLSKKACEIKKSDKFRDIL